MVIERNKPCPTHASCYGDQMNHLKSHVFLFTFIATTCLFVAHAWAGVTDNGNLAIYNSGQALVSEARSVNLPSGPANVVIRDIPAAIDATSIRTTANQTDVLGIQYRFTPATERNLLNRYIGKELTVLVPSLDGSGHTKRKGVLLSNAGKPVFLFGKEVYAGPYGGLLFPELPKSIDEMPSLVLNTRNDAAGKRTIRLSYLMSGISWRAHYALTVNKRTDAGQLTGWATVTNSGTHDFTSAALTLVAGDLRRAMPPRGQRAAQTMEADRVMNAPPNIKQGTLSQYHTYKIDDRIDLPGDSLRQIRLTDAPSVGVTQKLESVFHAHGNIHSPTGRQTVSSHLSIDNTKENGLGRPLPAGTIRVYMKTGDGQPLLVGEPSIPHTGIGEGMELTLGNAFDVSVERSRENYKKLGKRSYEVTWRIAVRNGKATPQRLNLKDMYAGDWKVTQASGAYTKPDDQTLLFDLTVPPTQDGTPYIVTYTAQVSY